MYKEKNKIGWLLAGNMNCVLKITNLCKCQSQSHVSRVISQSAVRSIAKANPMKHTHKKLKPGALSELPISEVAILKLLNDFLTVLAWVCPPDCLVTNLAKQTCQRMLRN